MEWKKNLWHMMLLYSVPGSHIRSPTCAVNSHWLASWVSSWTTGSNSSGSNVPLLSSKWKHPRFRKWFQFGCSTSFYNFTLSKNDWILSDSNHQLQDLFAICRQCPTACIYTCQQLFDFGCVQSFLIQLGEKVQTRLLKGVAGELVYKGLRLVR